MMERKLFGGEESKSSTSILDNLNEKDAQTVFNLCARICKSIMKKLSATHDTEFRGRVHKLIASVFPLNHPSGLNKPGNFNLKNVTQFESKEEIKDQIERTKGGANAAAGVPGGA
jgi:hypothetical protein